MGKNKKWVQLIIFSIVLIVGVFTIISNLSADSQKFPQVGEKAPDFSLFGMDGQVHKLSEYKGKTVVVNFWGTYCQPCKEEMPAIQKQYDKWKNQGVEFLEVNIAENQITIQSFVDQNHLKLPILLDANESVRKKYGVLQYPTTFFIQSNGIIKNKNVGGMEETFIDQTLAGMLGSK